MLFPWAANDRRERGLAIHALRMAINLGLPAHKAAFKHGSRTALLVIRRSQKSFESNISKIVKSRPVRMWLLLRYATDGMSERFERSQVGQWSAKPEVLFKPDFQKHAERWTGVGKVEAEQIYCGQTFVQGKICLCSGALQNRRGGRDEL